MLVSSILTADPRTIDVGADVDEALQSMESVDARHLPVVDGGRLVGVLSDRDLLEATGWMPSIARRAGTESHWIGPTTRVLEIMRPDPVTTPSDASVAHAVTLLCLKKIGCLPVVDGGELVGIVTESDVARAFVQGCVDGSIDKQLDPPVSELMSERVHWVGPETTLAEALGVSRSLGVRHLPVMSGDRLAGILSDRDFRRAIGRDVSENTAVEEVMTSGALEVRPECLASVAGVYFVEGKLGALPVVAQGLLEGIFTLTDLLDHCLEVFGGVD